MNHFNRVRQPQTHTPQRSDLAVLYAKVGRTASMAIDRAICGQYAVLHGIVLDQHLGHTAVCLYLNGAPPATVRDIVEVAWIIASHDVIAEAGTELLPMLRYAAFPVPSSLPDTMPAWRATRGIKLDQAQGGFSWSLDRDAAASWMQVLKNNYGVKGVPLLIKRQVSKSQILFYTNRNALSEVILDAPPAGDVDGTHSDWHTAGYRHRARLISEGVIRSDAAKKYDQAMRRT